MSSPTQQYRYQYPGYVGQPYQDTESMPQPDHRSSQAYPTQYYQNPVKYLQPHKGAPASFVAELSGSTPSIAPVTPARPAITPDQQLIEDEQLAQKLQQMEVNEANAQSRSNSNLSQRSSTIGAPTTLQNPASQAYQLDQLMRPHSLSASPAPTYGAHLSPLHSPSLLPEMVVGSQPELVPAAAHGTRYSQEDFSLFPEVVSASPQFSSQPEFASAPDPAFLSAYVEQNREVPYPPQWLLPPIISTLYSVFERAPKVDFLEPPETQIWRTTRFSKTGRNPPPPAFTFRFKARGGTFRDPQHTWTMTSPSSAKSDAWSYHLRRDKHTGMRKEEGLRAPRSRMEILTTYVSALNYDSLRFHGNDGRLYMWVTQAPLGLAEGSRYDTLRHALFVADPRSGTQDPLYGQIVADHTYWDGFVDTADVHAGTRCAGCSAEPINGLRWKCKTCPDHDICETCRLSSFSITPACKFTLVNLPDETLHIRNPAVEASMVVATLQVMKDWEMHTLRERRGMDPHGFKATVDATREGDLGRMRHWKASDFHGHGAKAEDAYGTIMKAVDCMSV